MEIIIVKGGKKSIIKGLPLNLRYTWKNVYVSSNNKLCISSGDKGNARDFIVIERLFWLKQKEFDILTCRSRTRRFKLPYWKKEGKK